MYDFRNKSLHLFFIGIVLGIVLGFHIQKCRVSTNGQNKSQISIDTKRCDSAKRTENQEPSELLFIGIVAGEGNSESNSSVLKLPWDHDHATVFCVNSSGHCHIDGRDVINLQSPTKTLSHGNERVMLKILEYMRENYINKYEWFLVAIEPVYIDINKLTFTLHSLNSTKSCYISNAETKENVKMPNDNSKGGFKSCGKNCNTNQEWPDWSGKTFQ